METTPDIDRAAPWRRLLRAALILLILVAVIVTAYVQTIIPPILVFAVLFVVALFLLSRAGTPRTVGTVIGGIGSLLFMLGNLPFVIEDLQHPESFLPFLATGMGVVGAILGFVAMLGALFKWSGAPTRALMAIGGAAVVLFAAVGLVSTLGVESDEREDGDIVVVAEKVDFFLEGDDPERSADAEVTLGAGAAVFVDNKDLFGHNFTVEALDIEVDLPANTARRIVVDADPGEYEFVCTIEGHEEDMAGTLVVE
ncbi:MAG TPA: cupredoxin domain-containing protein [Acidimicrobiales bacterium]